MSERSDRGMKASTESLGDSTGKEQNHHPENELLKTWANHIIVDVTEEWRR